VYIELALPEVKGHWCKLLLSTPVTFDLYIELALTVIHGSGVLQPHLTAVYLLAAEFHFHVLLSTKSKNQKWDRPGSEAKSRPLNFHYLVV